MPIDRDLVMDARPICVCCRKRLTRIVIDDSAWNESGRYLFQCLNTGRITPIADIERVLREDRQEAR